MRFVEPLYGLLFLPLIAGLILSWKHIFGLAKPRKLTAFVMRAFMASCLILALMGPQAVRPNKGLTTIFVLDRSDSIQGADQKKSVAFVENAMKAMKPEDKAGIVVFGAQPAVESAVGGRRAFRQVSSELDGSASNLASAIRVASASFPDGTAKRIVVLSDGNETSGDALEAVEVARSDDITVDFLALGTESQRAEASILDVQAPSERAADEPFDLRVIIESSVPQEGTLVIDRDGVVVSRLRVQLNEGKNAFLVPQRLDNSGFFRYRAFLEVPRDTDDRNNTGASFVGVKGKPRLLLVQGDPTKKELANALASQGIAVDLVSAGGLPTRPEDFQPYDAVIYNDLNATLVSEGQMSLMRAAVRDTGIGYAMIGGENSFLSGGWYGTSVAEILPVDLNVRQRQSFPSTTVYIISDTSGSMGAMEGGVTKLQLAANAAIQTAKLLSANDKLGVAGSESRIQEVAPIQDLKDIEKVISDIKKLRPGGGGIYVEPSVTFAKGRLESDNSKVRHFILLADGADAEQPGMSMTLVSQMLQNKITTTVVAIGDGPDVPMLKGLAAAGGGNFYLAKNASQLPAIFTQDVALISRSAIEEGAFVPKLVTGDEILRGIAATPPLLAYCLTDSRPLARTIMRTHKDDPLLATWQFGLGTSLAFTSDAQNQWAGQWINWDSFSTFWAQAVRSLSRKATINDYAVDVVQEGAKGEIKIEAKTPGGEPLMNPNLKVNLSDPNGESKELSLIQTAPGEYSGSFEAEKTGSYIVSIDEKGAQGEQRIGTAGFSVSYPPEYRLTRVNTPLLEEIGRLGGGKELTQPKEAMRPVEIKGKSISDLWIWFLLAGALILPLDVAIRRVVIPFGDLFKSKKKKKQEEAVVEKPSQRLSKAKKRVQDAYTAPKEKQEIFGKKVKTEIQGKSASQLKEVEPESVEEEEEEMTTVSAASKLLEARRARERRRNKP